MGKNLEATKELLSEAAAEAKIFKKERDDLYKERLTLQIEN